MFLDTSVKYRIHQQKVVYVSYLSFHIYIVYLVCVLYLLNLVFRLVDKVWSLYYITLLW
jgi:hypothetical protein